MRRDRKPAEAGLSSLEYILWLLTSAAMLAGIFFIYSGWFRPKPPESINKSQQTRPADSPAKKGTEAPAVPVAQPHDSTPAPPPLVLALFGSLLASIAWNAKQTIASLTNRAQLRIIETLSWGKSMQRHQLKAAVKREARLLKMFPEPIDQALLVLLMEGKVKINKGVYSLVTEEKESDGAPNLGD